MNKLNGTLQEKKKPPVRKVSKEDYEPILILSLIIRFYTLLVTLAYMMKLLE
jgi:hypothetical protein